MKKPWTFEGNVVDALPEGAIGFLYAIVTTEKRIYLGKTKRKHWKKYSGGGTELEEYHKENTSVDSKRIILQFFNDEDELLEAENRLIRNANAVEDPKFYNRYYPKSPEKKRKTFRSLTLNAEQLERFENHCAPEPNSGCWLWISGVNKKNYGAMRIDGTKMSATRISLMHFKGVVFEDGEYANHTCDNPFCVNPDHLYKGTSLDNARDRDARGRTSRGKKHSAIVKKQNPKTRCMKLTHEQVRILRFEAKPMVENGLMDIRVLAEILKVHPISIKAIFNNKSWKHVTQ